MPTAALLSRDFVAETPNSATNTPGIPGIPGAKIGNCARDCVGGYLIRRVGFMLEPTFQKDFTMRRCLFSLLIALAIVSGRSSRGNFVMAEILLNSPSCVPIAGP